MKIANECFKCKSRFCDNGIISTNDFGKQFNEIACPKHTDDLYSYADEVLGSNNGVIRKHISTTGNLSRRLMIKDLEEKSKKVSIVK